MYDVVFSEVAWPAAELFIGPHSIDDARSIVGVASLKLLEKPRVFNLYSEIISQKLVKIGFYKKSGQQNEQETCCYTIACWR